MLERFEISVRRPVLEGKPFGDTGAYEQIEGSAWFVVDPSNPLNEPIVDLKLAPRNAAGLVECRADIWVLKPVDCGRGNGSLLHYISNRGRKGVLTVFNLASGANRPTTEEEFGDGFLMEQGYVVGACAWQADVPPEAVDTPHLITLDVPVVRLQDGPISVYASNVLCLFNSLTFSVAKTWPVAEEMQSTCPSSTPCRIA